MGVCRVCGNETIARRRTCSDACITKSKSNGSKSKEIRSKIKEYDEVGKLTLLYKTYKSVGVSRPHNDAYWYCICECGNTAYVRGCAITSGCTRSCGCLHTERVKENVKKAIQKNTKYSKDIRDSAIFKRWRGILSRTQVGVTSKNYKIYPGKGISVCNEWKDFYVFKSWAENSGFDPCLTIDRIDNSKGYSPDNCRWVSMSENLKNRVLHYGSKPWLIGNKHGLKNKTC